MLCSKISLHPHHTQCDFSTWCCCIIRHIYMCQLGITYRPLLSKQRIFKKILYARNAQTCENVRQFIFAQLHSSIICFLHEIVENYRYSLFVAKIKLYLIFGMRQLSSWNKKIPVNPNPDLLQCLRVMKRINGFLFLRNDKTFLFSTKRFWLNRKSGIRTCHIEMVFIV